MSPLPSPSPTPPSLRIDTYTHPPPGEPPPDADFSGVQTSIGAAKKREMRSRLKDYLEERLNSSANEFVGAFGDTAIVDDNGGRRRDGDDGGEAGEKSKAREKATRLDSTGKKVAAKEAAESRNRDVVSEWGRWQALVDNRRGLIYYFDESTRESTWDRPEGFPPFKLSASRRIALEERNRLYLEWHEDSDEGNAARAGGGDAAASDSISNDRTGQAPVSTRGFEVGVAQTEGAGVDRARGDVVVVSDSNSNDKTEGRPESTAGFEADMARIADVVDEFVAAGEGRIDPDRPPALLNSNPSPVLPAMTVNDNGNDVNTLPIVQKGEWSAYFDVKSGLVFYFNEETEETSWNPPFANFPRIVMDASGPSVLDSGDGNISMERALGYIGVDEMTEALAWEEAKKEERARKAAKRAEEAKADGGTAASEAEGGAVTKMYEAAKRAELERMDRDRTLAAEEKAREDEADKLAELRAATFAAEEKAREDEAAKLAELRAADVAANLVNQEKQERLKEKRERVARDREASAKSAMQERLERERLDKERLEKERLEVERNAIPVGIDPKRPVRPKVERSEDGGGGFLSFWWGRKRTTVQTNTLYTVLGCSSGASRAELKRSYLSLAKETHPDALLQIGIVNDDKTERRFTEIAQAWKVLGDPTSRRRYDRELQAKGISSTAGNIFEALVMGAAQALDEVLAVAEESLDK